MVKVGIPGVDEVLEGGIPRTHAVLVAGPVGSGKTLFGLQYLCNGIKNKEKGLFVSFEEDLEDILRNTENTPFNIKKHTDEKNLMFVKYDPYKYQDLIGILKANIVEHEIKRVVIDSISALNLYIENQKDIRIAMVESKKLLKRFGCTPFFLGEIMLDTPNKLSTYGVEEFVADGIIILYYTKTNTEYTRSMSVLKMRGVSHSKKVHPFRISDKGIKVYSREEAFVKF